MTDHDLDDLIEQEEITFDHPEEGDVITEDHVHWYADGKLILTTKGEDGSCADDWAAQVLTWMDEQWFWPNVFFLSDHGNCHIISLWEERELADRRRQYKERCDRNIPL